MKLKALSLPDLEQVRLWRNEQVSCLRTPFLLTEEQQEQFYRDVVCNRQANARFWGIWASKKVTLPMQKPMGDIEAEEEIFIGMCGLENIRWENRLAEISLLLDPQYPMEKYSEEALRLLLEQGFLNMNLRNIFTEVYECNPNIDVWLAIFQGYLRANCIVPVLPNRKYWNGQYYNSVYLNFLKEDFLEHENLISKSAQALN